MHSSGTRSKPRRARRPPGTRRRVARRGEDAADDVRDASPLRAMITLISSVVSRGFLGAVALDARCPADRVQALAAIVSEPRPAARDSREPRAPLASCAARPRRGAGARRGELAEPERAEATRAARAPGGRPRRTSAAPGGFALREARSRDVAAAAMRARCAGAVRPSSSSRPSRSAPARARRSPAADARPVGIRHLVARMREQVRELAVVGEQDQAAGVGVEPPHRVETSPLVGIGETTVGAPCVSRAVETRRQACSARTRHAARRRPGAARRARRARLVHLAGGVGLARPSTCTRPARTSRRRAARRRRRGRGTCEAHGCHRRRHRIGDRAAAPSADGPRCSHRRSPTGRARFRAATGVASGSPEAPGL